MGCEEEGLNKHDRPLLMYIAGGILAGGDSLDVSTMCLVPIVNCHVEGTSGIVSDPALLDDAKDYSCVACLHTVCPWLLDNLVPFANRAAACHTQSRKVVVPAHRAGAVHTHLAAME